MGRVLLSTLASWASYRMILLQVGNISKHIFVMMLFDYKYQNSFQFCSLILKVINTDRDSICFFFFLTKFWLQQLLLMKGWSSIIQINIAIISLPFQSSMTRLVMQWRHRNLPKNLCIKLKVFVLIVKPSLLHFHHNRAECSCRLTSSFTTENNSWYATVLLWNQWLNGNGHKKRCTLVSTERMQTSEVLKG